MLEKLRLGTGFNYRKEIQIGEFVQPVLLDANRTQSDQGNALCRQGKRSANRVQSRYEKVPLPIEHTLSYL
jgi:hypothetical protein